MPKRCTAPELADRLRGSASSMPSWALESSKKFLEDFDALVFECTTCNNWCDDAERTEDADGEQICIECKTGGDGDE